MLKGRWVFEHGGVWNCLLGESVPFLHSCVGPAPLAGPSVPVPVTTDLHKQRAGPTSGAGPLDAGAASTRPSKPVAPSCSVGQTGRPGPDWSEGTARNPSSDAEDTDSQESSEVLLRAGSTAVLAMTPALVNPAGCALVVLALPCRMSCRRGFYVPPKGAEF